MRERNRYKMPYDILMSKPLFETHLQKKNTSIKKAINRTTIEYEQNLPTNLLN